ncbi:hypothetical protein H3V53_30630 [Paraburkholderia bengalensis]|uniref:Uncharacterized protein n=1 Tax=Paraburkholderia bengalensis TaxID=2747562 RepID=A0ABU8J0S9_9BURK
MIVDVREDALPATLQHHARDGAEVFALAWQRRMPLFAELADRVLAKPLVTDQLLLALDEASGPCAASDCQRASAAPPA